MTSASAPKAPSSRAVYLAVLVAALGYFVDIYDLILFSVIRKKSLLSLGVPEAQVTDVGLHLLDMQMGGMLVGGVLWGMLGDKRGRLSVLFGSILLYSLANIANGAVTDVETYAYLRFIAGVGLAGELGAGVTLVSELMSRTSRGYGTTVIAGIGVLGAVLAAIIDRSFDWRVAYYIGGAMGLGLLALRVGVRESGMFQQTKQTGVSRGNFLQIFADLGRAKRFLCLILIGVPIWYIIGILITLSPEIGKGLGLVEMPVPGTAVMVSYTGLAVGDVASGLLSQRWKSRKRTVLAFLALSAAMIALYFAIGGDSVTSLYVACFAVGVGGGYWAVFVTMASEQFGTNLRATVTTSAPNFVRGALVLLNFGFKEMKEPHGVVRAAALLGVATIVVALFALRGLDETFGKDLDYVERA